MTGWRNIKTAPTDGTPIVGGYFDSNPRLRWVGEVYYEKDGDRGWFAANTHWTDASANPLMPNRWLPMPEKPTG